MAISRVGSIEVFTIDEDIQKYTRKEREKIIGKLFKNKYQGKELTYFLNGEEISAIINKTTRKNFTTFSHSHSNPERYREYKTRQDIACSGDYLELIQNMEYQRSADEHYPGQSDRHLEGNHWHYFEKDILCNGFCYRVTLDIREKNNQFYIYNTKIKEVMLPFEQQNIFTTSSNSIIDSNQEFVHPNESEIEQDEYELEI